MSDRSEPHLDTDRIPSELQPQLRLVEGDLTPVQQFQNALRRYWTVAGAAVGPEANAAAVQAAETLAMARGQAADDGVNVELVESEFQKQLGVKLDQGFDLAGDDGGM